MTAAVFAITCISRERELEMMEGRWRCLPPQDGPESASWIMMLLFFGLKVKVNLLQASDKGLTNCCRHECCIVCKQQLVNKRPPWPWFSSVPNRRIVGGCIDAEKVSSARWYWPVRILSVPSVGVSVAVSEFFTAKSTACCVGLCNQWWKLRSAKQLSGEQAGPR